MHDPASIDTPKTALSLEQEVLNYFGPDAPAPHEKPISDDSQTELFKLRQDCTSMRQQLFKLCWQFQCDCESVDLIEMFSLVARLKRTEQTETGLAKRLQGG